MPTDRARGASDLERSLRAAGNQAVQRLRSSGVAVDAGPNLAEQQGDVLAGRTIGSSVGSQGGRVTSAPLGPTQDQPEGTPGPPVAAEEEQAESLDPKLQAALMAALAIPPLDPEDQVRLRTAIGSTRAYGLLEQKQAMLRHFAREEGRGMGILRYTNVNQQAMAHVELELQAELARLGLRDEEDLVRLVEVQLPEQVLARARQIADTMLQQNLATVLAEKERYSKEVCSPDTDGLLAADEELGRRHSDIEVAQAEINEATQYMSGVSAGIATTPEEFGIPPEKESLMVVISNIEQYRARLEQSRAEYATVHQAYGARYPILLAEGYVPGRFSSAPEQLSRLTAEPLEDIEENISDVRKDIANDHLKIWAVHYAVYAAMRDMGIDQDPVLAPAVEDRIRQHQEDEGFLRKLKAALAIGTTIAAFLLGGPLAGSVVSALWSAEAAAESIGTYMMEKAAENVALDPAIRDISVNEPELMWVVIDLIGLGLDIGAVASALRPFARAALKSGRLADFAVAARRIVPQTAERLVGSLRRQLGRRAAAAAVVEEVSGAGRTLEEYVEALRAQPRTRGSVGGTWDHTAQPRGLPESQWRPGDPIDMPSSRGGYPPYDTARQRYWRNRVYYEREARARGEAVFQPGNTTSPVAGLTDEELETMQRTGRAPEYRYANRPGQTWELEHAGVPQRVRDWLIEAGLKREQAQRFIRESAPGALIEVTPLEHAFFDVEARSFGRLRADVTGSMWEQTPWADIRGARPLEPLTQREIEQLVDLARTGRINLSAGPGALQLRDALNAEIQARGLLLSLP